MVLLLLAACQVAPPLLVASAKREDTEEDGTIVISTGWVIAGEESHDQLGAALAGAGDVDGDGFGDVLVGVPREERYLTNPGAARLYLGSAAGLSYEVAWSFPNVHADAGCGGAVAGAGDVNADGFADVLVGASRDSATGTGEGAAYIFLGGPDGLAATPDWSATGAAGGAAFGSTVAGAGDVNGDGMDDLLVGAPGAADGGRAYLWAGGSGLETDGAWDVGIARDGATFGTSVAGLGDVNRDGYADIAVGAPGAGEVHVFLGSAAGLTTAATVLAAPPTDRLGASVSTAGDVDADGYDDIIVGLPGASDGDGEARVYTGGPTGVAAAPLWTGAGTDRSALGASVAGGGDVDADGFADVLVGAPGWTGDIDTEGAMLLYRGGSSGPSVRPDWSREGDAMSMGLGATVAAGGDVDGDGFSEVLGGAPDDVYHWGWAVLAYGSAAGPGGTHPWSWSAHGAIDSYFGYTVAVAGDLDGDGVEDFAAWSFYTYEVLVWAGSPTPGEPATIPSPAGGGIFGVVMANVGDLDGDGSTTLAVGNPMLTDDLLQQGAVFLFDSARGTLDPLLSRGLEGTAYNGGFGRSIAGAGDVTGDGYDDLVIGAPLVSTSFSEEGAVYAWYGGPSGVGAEPDYEVTGGFDDAELGWTLAGGSDVDGDGIDDVVAGGVGASPVDDDGGRLALYLGGVDGLADAPTWVVRRDADSYCGRSLVTGDLDGDGTGDVVVGCPYWSDGVTGSVGHVEVYFSGPGGPRQIPDATYEGTEDGEEFGSSLALGDADGDGLTDIAVGAPRYTRGTKAEGRVTVLPGSGAPAVAVEVDLRSAEAGKSIALVDIDGDRQDELLVGAPYVTGAGLHSGAIYLWDLAGPGSTGGDTGSGDSGTVLPDTGPPSPTGADTGPTDGIDVGGKAPGCGCAADSAEGASVKAGLLLLAVTVLTRRRQPK